MNLRTYPGYENIPWKQEGHAIQRLDIHIQFGTEVGRQLALKVKCANSTCGISIRLSFWGRGWVGICFHTITYLNCAVMLLNHAPRVICTALARLQLRGNQAFMYCPWFVVHWNF